MMEKSLSVKKITQWALYDFATSTYFAVILTFVFASYYSKMVAPNPVLGTVLWGHTLSISAISIAIICPILGAIIDQGIKHRNALFFFTVVGAIGTGLLWFSYPASKHYLLPLIAIFISNTAFEISQMIYNSYLPWICPHTYIGRVSGLGWGCGYFGGLICLTLSLVLFINDPFSLFGTTSSSVRATMLLVSSWIIIFSIPIFFLDGPKLSVTPSKESVLKLGFKNYLDTLKSLSQQRTLSLFLLSRLLYTDGLNTIFAFGGIYVATTFNFSINQVLLFGIALNVSAGIGVCAFAWLDDGIGSKKTILISIIGLSICLITILNTYSVKLLWIISFCLGLFVGPIQGASRTMLSRLVDKDEITKMYGFYALSGKVASFIGPFLVATLTQLTGNQRTGLLVILPLLVIGGAILSRIDNV